MKILLACRHAKALKNAEMGDHDRPLLPEGFDAVRGIAALIAGSDLMPEAVYCSTAVRAVETMEAFIEASGFSGKKELKRGLYGAQPAAYVDVLNRVQDHFETVMVVGHNPEIEEFVRKLTGQGLEMKTADVAVLRIPVEHWYDLSFETVCALQTVLTVHKSM